MQRRSFHRPPSLSHGTSRWCGSHVASVRRQCTSARSPGVADAQFTLTLERALGSGSALDAELWRTGVFSASVYPDLPVATTWQNLHKALWKRLVPPLGSSAAASAAASAAVAPAQPLGSALAAAPLPGSAAAANVVVTTVGAQLRTRRQLQARLLAAAGSGGGDGAAPPRALLLLSGSHPVRRLPGVAAALPNAVTLLRDATALRSQGLLKPETQLWAVANPVMERDASWAESKVEAGAQVLLTQPPLDWGAFEAWWSDAERRGVTTAARVLVGLPMLSGSANAGFWCALAGMPAAGAATRALVGEFAAAEAAAHGDGGGAFTAWALDWNRRLLQQLLATRGVGGLHVMPITQSARRLTLQLVRSGELPPGGVAAASGSSASSSSSSGPVAEQQLSSS